MKEAGNSGWLMFGGHGDIDRVNCTAWVGEMLGRWRKAGWSGRRREQCEACIQKEEAGSLHGRFAAGEVAAERSKETLLCVRSFQFFVVETHSTFFFI